MEEEEDEYPADNLSEITEYVREQLKSMGVDNVTDTDLEAYTKDFLQLLKEKEDEERTNTESSEEDYEVGKTNSVPQSVAPSAVYKTILQDTDSVLPSVAILSSPAHSLESVESFSDALFKSPDRPVIQVSLRSQGNRLIKRKVLRQMNQSFTDHTADISSLASDTINRSVTSTAADSSRLSNAIAAGPPKSFIRPTTGLPRYIKGTTIRKSDPVQRFHEYNECWKMMRPPGEHPRHGLRWHIREQLLLQDSLPPIPPPRKSCHPNSYVVPTTKKRQSLRWEIRHQLAHNSNN